MDPLRVNTALEALATADAELLRDKRSLEAQFDSAKTEENRELATARARRDEALASINNMRLSLVGLGAQLGVEAGSSNGQVLSPQEIHARETDLRQRWANVAVLEAAERALEQERHMAAPKKVLLWAWLGVAVVGLVSVYVLPALVVG